MAAFLGVMMMKLRFTLGGLIVVALCTTSYAQGFLVNWGGNYVSGSTDLNNKNANTSGNDQGTNFSLSTVLSPLSGYSGTSATFYGGGVVNLSSGSTLGWSEFQIQNQGSNDMIDFGIQHGNDQHTFSTALVWLKNDFLGVQPQIVFNSSSQFNISLTNAATSAMNNAQARWLVQDGSTMFLSEAFFVPTNGSYNHSPFVDGTSDGNWAVYSPSGLNMNFNQGGGFSTHKFTDITGVGVYFESDVHENTGQPYRWSITGFGVTAAVPEPASIMLIGSAAAGLGGYQFFRSRQRRQRKMAKK